MSSKYVAIRYTHYREEITHADSATQKAIELVKKHGEACGVFKLVAIINPEMEEE